jgi:hypothetical protein
MFILTPVNQVGMGTWAKIFIPIGFGHYWFMTDFVLLMLISPALNILISNISREKYRNLLLGATILWSIIPIFTSASYGFSEIGWFVVLYLYAGYIRKYVDINKQKGKKHLIIAIVSYLLVIISNVSLIFLGHVTDIETFTNQSTRFMALNSPLIIITSVELLIGFASLKPYYNRKINVWASATLGVYLIHEHTLFRPYLWQVILKNPEIYSSNLLVVHAIISIAAVYLICSCIDLIRQYTVEKLFMGIVNKHLEQMVNKGNSIADNVNRKVNSILSWYYK